RVAVTRALSNPGRGGGGWTYRKGRDHRKQRDDDRTPLAELLPFHLPNLLPRLDFARPQLTLVPPTVVIGPEARLPHATDWRRFPSFEGSVGADAYPSSCLTRRSPGNSKVPSNEGGRDARQATEC